MNNPLELHTMILQNSSLDLPMKDGSSTMHQTSTQTLSLEMYKLKLTYLKVV